MDTMTLASVAQTFGTIAAVVIATLALTRDKKKDNTEEKQLCIKHDETIKQLLGNHEMLSKRVEQACLNGQGHDVKIAQMEVQLANLLTITYEIKQTVKGISDLLTKEKQHT